MARRGRRSARNSGRAPVSRTPTPLAQSDNEMPDGSPAADSPQPGELEDGQEIEEAEMEDAEEEFAEEEVATTPAADSDDHSRLRTRQQPAAPVQQAPPAKRRGPGRPPKNRPVEYDASDIESRGASDAGTPKKRGGFRGRPGFGAGRWKKTGSSHHTSQIALDKDGTMVDVVDGEAQLPDDPDGEDKVDKLGELKGGREYRVRTFTVLGFGKRLYMLSTEPARCIGFRDSYLFFQKHPKLVKIILTDDQKMDLIRREIIPHSYKGRQIGVVTARSVFREFGSKIIIGGKKIMDDYLEAEAIANGDVAGELATPEDTLPPPGEDYDRNRYVAWHGASSVYHQQGQPTVPVVNGKAPEVKKKRTPVTDMNWKLEHARAASEYNSRINAQRRENLKGGVYEPYTNMMHYPRNTQPTHARWEQVHHPAGSADQTNGASQETPETKFPTPSYQQLRNYMTVDSVMRQPPASSLGEPGPSYKNSEFDVGRKGLCDVTDEVIACLPEECLAPFLEAREQERKWRESFGNEAKDGARAEPKITYST